MLFLREDAEAENERRRLTAEWLAARRQCSCREPVLDRLYLGAWLCRRCQALREETQS
jgi:ribosomal protein L37AE/L43A